MISNKNIKRKFYFKEKLFVYGQRLVFALLNITINVYIQFKEWYFHLIALSRKTTFFIMRFSFSFAPDQVNSMANNIHQHLKVI